MKDVLERIEEALRAVKEVFQDYTPGKVDSERKAGGDPVTEADHASNRALLELLPRDGEGWLSEETLDDRSRLDHARVWIVDPLDGTKEFVTGIPEWCVSVGYVEEGVPVAGGIYNPATDELILGARGEGVSYNGSPAAISERDSIDGALVLASRSEVKRGEWTLFDEGPFTVRPMGSVAYKLGLVAAGRADATWTVVPKNEWDVAAGTALVLAAGGEIHEPKAALPTFNRENTLLEGLIAHPTQLTDPVAAQIERHLSHMAKLG